MIDDSARPDSADPVEAVLRERLVQDEAAAGSVVPVLRHLLANEDSAIFSDEIIARVRGMIADVARQLLDHAAGEPGDHPPEALAALNGTLISSTPFLSHVHALALEWQLTERLQARLALNPVLPPLVQALIASPDPATAELAMQFLAAQARFGQAQRRMKLALAELPGDLLHVALLALRRQAGSDAERADAAIRGAYDESRGRLGLIARLVTGMGGGAIAALSVGHAGVAIFLTALAVASGQERDAVALWTSEAQLARFALALRAAGLRASAIEEQMLALHPDLALPEGFDRIGPDRAAALLAAAEA